MRLLKQTTTGEIYPWTPQLAERSDMVEVGNEPVAQEPQRDLPSDEQPIQLQADEPAPAEEIPTENSESASADAELPPLDDAIESFRRQASKASKKKDDQDNG